MGMGSYITAGDIRTTRLNGSYREANFPLPVDPLLNAGAAPAAAASVAKAASRMGVSGTRGRGMSGGFQPAVWTIPPYRNSVAGMSGTLDDVKAWAAAPNQFLPSMSNGVVYGVAAAALYMFMGKRGRR